MRSARIVLLKITHAPYIAAIWVYEELYALSSRWQYSKSLQQRIHSTKRGIHTHIPIRRPNPKSRSEISMPKTPTSAKRPSAHELTDHDLSATQNAMNERLATIERKIERLTIIEQKIDQLSR